MKNLADLTLENGGPKVRLRKLSHHGPVREFRSPRNLSNPELARWLLYICQGRRVPAPLMAELRRWSINDDLRAVGVEDKRYSQ